MPQFFLQCNKQYYTLIGLVGIQILDMLVNFEIFMKLNVVVVGVFRDILFGLILFSVIIMLIDYIIFNLSQDYFGKRSNVTLVLSSTILFWQKHFYLVVALAISKILMIYSQFNYSKFSLQNEINLVSFYNNLNIIFCIAVAIMFTGYCIKNYNKI